MEARIELLESKKMLGMRQAMSLVDNKTFELFGSFMPRRKEILHPKGDHIFDLREYPEHYFAKFNPAKPFTKWALMEVEVFDDIPNGMEQFDLVAGLYAVFCIKVGTPGPKYFNTFFPNGCPLQNTSWIIDLISNFLAPKPNATALILKRKFGFPLSQSPEKNSVYIAFHNTSKIVKRIKPWLIKIGIFEP